MAVIQPVSRPAYNNVYQAWGRQLDEDYAYETDDGYEGVIPAGYWWNGANIPAAFWQIIDSPNHPKLDAPSLVHDWMYSVKIKNREVSDATLMKYLEAMLVPEYKRVLIFKAVRLFGEKYWKDSAQDKLYLYRLRLDLRDTGRDPMVYGI